MRFASLLLRAAETSRGRHADLLVAATLSLGIGCGFASSDNTPDLVTVDAASDGPVSIDTCLVGEFDFCSSSLPVGPALEINTNTVMNTDTDPNCQAYLQAGGPTACLVYAQSLTISQSATLRVIGSRPLVIASGSSITIAGTLDGSSERGGATGPNANFASGCAPASVPQNDQGGAGGGAGGSFRGTGGNGGDGDTDNSFGGDGNSPGGIASTALTTPPAYARGGCAGAKGGNESGSAGQGGAGGASGGALWLYARGSISVPVGGVIRATGAGGAGGDVQSGGGGGGSGGYIRLSGAQIAIAGTVAANGGAAGGGGCRCSGNDIAGDPGEDGHAAASSAAGGDGADISIGDGGNGSSAASILGQSGANAIVGGGGGGGGAGFIVLVGLKSVTGVISPPAL
ncbi:MAG: hypothetical protein AB7P03_26475 [Kofleriaceae bacterium]